MARARARVMVRARARVMARARARITIVSATMKTSAPMVNS